MRDRTTSHRIIARPTQYELTCRLEDHMNSSSVTKASAALALLLALGLSACSGDTGSPGDPSDTNAPDEADTALDIEEVNTFDEIKADPDVEALIPDSYKSGDFTMALSAGAPPQTFVSEDGHTSLGSNADIARLLVRVMGIDAELVSVPFDAIIPGMVSGKYTVAMASMTPTAERLEQMDMIPFTSGGSAIAVPSGNPDGLSLDSLCGASVAVAAGTIQATVELPALNENCAGKDPISVVSVPDTNQAILALSNGRADAFMGDGVPLAYAVRSGEVNFDVLPDEITREGQYGNLLAMGVPKDSDLTPALVSAMQVVVAMPEYTEIFEKWGMDGYELDDSQIEQLK